jgi:hypothetical protein
VEVTKFVVQDCKRRSEQRQYGKRSKPVKYFRTPGLGSRSRLKERLGIHFANSSALRHGEAKSNAGAIAHGQSVPGANRVVVVAMLISVRRSYAGDAGQCAPHGGEGLG